MASQNRKTNRQRRISSAMGGANDPDSGGGAGSGTPDAETNIRTGGAASRGDVEQDRQRLFPEKFGPPQGRQNRPRKSGREHFPEQAGPRKKHGDKTTPPKEE